MRTARQAEGPFYPDKLPLDTDNDLLIVNDVITPAVGEITHLSGRIFVGITEHDVAARIGEKLDDEARAVVGAIRHEAHHGELQHQKQDNEDGDQPQAVDQVLPSPWPGPLRTIRIQSR